MANPGKLIQKFSRNFSFPGRDTDRFLKNSSSIFSKFQFPGHEMDWFLENSSINFANMVAWLGHTILKTFKWCPILTRILAMKFLYSRDVKITISSIYFCNTFLVFSISFIWFFKFLSNFLRKWLFLEMSFFCLCYICQVCFIIGSSFFS